MCNLTIYSRAIRRPNKASFKPLYGPAGVIPGIGVMTHIVMLTFFRPDVDSLQLNVPLEDTSGDRSKYWVVGCFDSLNGQFEPVNELVDMNPFVDPSICELTKKRN